MALGVLAACQSDEAPDNNSYLSDPDAVVVKAYMGKLESRGNVIGDGTEWASGDAIHVENVSPGAVAGKNVAVYTYNGTDFLPGDKYIVWADGKNSFKAYYPYNENGSVSYAMFQLPLDQSSDDPRMVDKYIGYADWMTAEVNDMVKTGDKSISLQFRHRLARVTVKIIGYNNQFGSTLPNVDTPIFSIPDDMGDSNVIYGKDDKVRGLASYSVNNDGKHSFVAILPSGKYGSGDLLMTLNVGGQTLKVLPSAYLMVTGLDAGKAYTVNLTVGKNLATISGISVAEWETGWDNYGTALEQPAATE